MDISAPTRAVLDEFLRARGESVVTPERAKELFNADHGGMVSTFEDEELLQLCVLAQNELIMNLAYQVESLKMSLLSATVTPPRAVRRHRR